MTFERSKDYATIRDILNDARCYRKMANDAAPKDLQVGPVSGIDYVLAKDGAHPVAVFLICGGDYPPAVAEIHFAFIPEVWGATRIISEEFLAWVWRNTSLNWLIGPVPEYNRLAMKLAQSVGFVARGVKREAGMKNGRPFDLLIHDIVRPAMKGVAA